jgi:glycosyltransferase involved in cell wall biosynthesis
MTAPLVSILTPAYNADQWIAEAIRSALAQTWKHKEIIVVDDGSTDQTLSVARRFESSGVRVLTQKRQGAAAARNYALEISRGAYIQWLDADDLLAPDKIERQLGALQEGDSDRILLSSSWAPFYYRTRHAKCLHNSLCQDLSPVEWLLRKMGENLHMQPATWLTSRQLADAAGPWDTRLRIDDDGEYFCRVLLASDRTRFVPEAKVYYRITSPLRLSHIGASNEKKEAMLLSMRLHIQWIRSLEDTDRVRRACLTYVQSWYDVFYPERPDLMAQVQDIAAALGGRLDIPQLRKKYFWLEPISGRKGAKWVQTWLPYLRIWLARQWDRALYGIETHNSPSGDEPGGSFLSRVRVP